MSIEYVYGDIFESKAEALVNPVNCVGIMGKGLALQFKQKFPKMFNEYKAACDSRWYKPGNVFIYTLPGSVPPRYIFCAATKNHWRDQSSLDIIETCVANIFAQIVKYKIPSIAVPALGCGEGRMNWNVVQDVLHRGFGSLSDTQVLVYPPHMGVSAKKPERPVPVPAMSLPVF